MCLLINVFVAIFIEKQQQYYSVEHLIKPYSIIDPPNDIAQHTWNVVLHSQMFTDIVQDQTKAR